MWIVWITSEGQIPNVKEDKAKKDKTKPSSLSTSLGAFEMYVEKDPNTTLLNI